MSREWFVECYLEDKVNDLIENEGMSEADAIAYVEEELIDGLCCYSTKIAATNNALKAGATNVFSPSGIVVWSRPKTPHFQQSEQTNGVQS